MLPITFWTVPNISPHQPCPFVPPVPQEADAHDQSKASSDSEERWDGGRWDTVCIWYWHWTCNSHEMVCLWRDPTPWQDQISWLVLNASFSSLVWPLFLHLASICSRTAMLLLRLLGPFWQVLGLSWHQGSRMTWQVLLAYARPRVSLTVPQCNSKLQEFRCTISLPPLGMTSCSSKCAVF